MGLIHTKTESRNLGMLGSCSFILLHVYLVASLEVFLKWNDYLKQEKSEKNMGQCIIYKWPLPTIKIWPRYFHFSCDSENQIHQSFFTFFLL